jgi:hypothetical protein
MAENQQPAEAIDWSLTTWDGARREALRRWAELPLERIIAALEEMQELTFLLTSPPASADPITRQDTGDSGGRAQEPHGEPAGVAERKSLADQTDGQGATGSGSGKKGTF